MQDIMKQVSAPTESEGNPLEVIIDPASEEKLNAVKEAVVKRMCDERARFVSAFENICFEENRVVLPVPTEALRDELLGMRFEILKTITEMAGIKGILEMVIEVKEIEFKLKPVKLDDRERHIHKVAPEMSYLAQLFDTINE